MGRLPFEFQAFCCSNYPLTCLGNTFVSSDLSSGNPVTRLVHSLHCSDKGSGLVRYFCRSVFLSILCICCFTSSVLSQGEWETTPASERALQKGLLWLSKNQGPEGNWNSNDLGVVGMGALAFLSAGYLPGRGRYGGAVEGALD